MISSQGRYDHFGNSPDAYILSLKFQKSNVRQKTEVARYALILLFDHRNPNFVVGVLKVGVEVYLHIWAICILLAGG